MLDKFIKEVVNIVVGHPIEKINSILKRDKYTNEFLIAKKLDIPVNHTRTFLYKLLEFGLVSSLREKDEKKGFYIYSWKLNALKSLEFLKNFLEKKIKRLEGLKEEKSHKQTYKCGQCIREVSVEDALMNDFYCVECGGLLEINDSTKVIDGINRKIIILKSKLDLVEEEIKKLKDKISLKEKKDMEEEAKMKVKKTSVKKKKDSKKETKVVKKKSLKKKTKIVKKKVMKKVSVKRKPVKKIIKKKVGIKKSDKKKIVKKKATKKKSVGKRPVKKKKNSKKETKVVKKKSLKKKTKVVKKKVMKKVSVKKKPVKKVVKKKVGLFSNIFKK